MPNIFVQRYFIFGSESQINQIFRTFFSKQDHLWKSHGLMEEDPLEYQIVNSGDFLHQTEMIAFSSYMGWDMHAELIEQMAKKLPSGTILLVIGYDMDDYPTEDGGRILEIEGGTGRRIKDELYPSQWISKYYFPLLAQI
jgi:hypothetical protein